MRMWNEMQMNAGTQNGLLGATNAMQADIKFQNRIRILELFRNGHPRTVNDIAAITGISRQTVAKAITHYCERGLLKSLGKGQSSSVGGKRPEIFRFDSAERFLCITMWPSELNFSIYDVCGACLFYEMNKMDFPASIDESLQIVRKMLEHFLIMHGIVKTDICAVSLSMSGTVNYKQQLLRYNSQKPEWGANIPIGDFLHSVFPHDPMFFIENAGKTTARSVLYDESLCKKRVLVLFVAWGLCATLIENGHILNGTDSLIGEVGHMVIDSSDEEQCGCGNHGCFERMVSIERIHKIMQAQTRERAMSSLASIPIESTTFQDIFGASDSNDAYARTLVDLLAERFAMALQNISLVFNQDIVIFQGNFSAADPYFDERLMAHLTKFRYFPEGRPFETRYDKRALSNLVNMGALYELNRMYFSNPALYFDDTPEDL